MPAKSKSQQRLFGMVHAYQKGKLKHAPASVRRIAKHISEEDAKHFAKTKHKGLPETKKAEVIPMTRYEQGFLSKCAEYGMSEHDAVALMKASTAHQNPQTGAYSNTDKGENALYQKAQHNPPVFANNLSFGQKLALWLNGNGWLKPYVAGSPYARGTGPQRF